MYQKGLLILLLSFIACQNISFCQSPSYSININNGRISDVLIDLTEQYDISFSYPTELLSSAEILSIHEKSNSLSELIAKCFEPFGIESRKGINNTFLLKQFDTKQSDFETNDDDVILKGIIVDGNYKTPIPYVSVAVQNTNQVVFTDEKGMFELPIKTSTKTGLLSIHILGYKTREVPISTFIKGERSTISIQQRPYEINEITILNSRPGKIIKSEKIVVTRKFNQNATSSLFGSDILRNLQMTAGIDARDDASTAIKIRGSNSDETMIILDGIPLFNTSHYYGILSAINSNYVDEVDIYKNAQPIDLGNKAAGVVYMKSKNKIPEHIEGTVNINFIVPSLQLSIPLNPKGLLNVSFRSNWSDLSNSNFYSFGSSAFNNINTSGQTPGGRDFTRNLNPKFSFWDTHVKLLQQIGNKHRLQLSFHGGNDAYLNQITNTLDRLQPNGDVIQEDIFTNIQNWDNYGFNLAHDFTISKNLSVATSAYHSRYETDFTNQTSLRFASTQFAEALNLNFDQFNKVNTSAFDSHVQLNKKQYQLTVGAKLKAHQTEFLYMLDGETELNDQLKAQEFTVYSEINLKNFNLLDLTIGNRFHYYSETNKGYFSPQMSAHFKADENWILKAHTGINYQFLREINIELPTSQNVNSWILANETFPVLQSFNSMIGFTYKRDHLYFDVEAYYKDMDGIVEYGSNNFNDESMQSLGSFTRYEGTGISKGIDFMVGYSTKIFDTHISYTLSQITYSMPDIFNGKEYNAQNDQRHQLKLNSSYKTGPWSFSTSGIFSSGRPYIDRNKVLDELERDRKKVDPKKFRSKLPDYLRLDIGVDYSINLSKNKVTLGASIFNLLDRSNVKYIQQIDRTRQGSSAENIILGSTSNLLQRTLNLNATLSF